MKTVAILGPTASGKTDLALRLARRFGAVILSLDSLSVYREIDIASAKPTPEERGTVPHCGIDLLWPDEPFHAAAYTELYRVAKERAQRAGRPLLIVGGTGFYLKTLMEGISHLPPLTDEARKAVATRMADLPKAYDALKRLDPEYAKRIAPADRYRIEKGWTVYETTGVRPTDWFASHPPEPLLRNVELYEIGMERERLWERIERRTRKMVEEGLVDEVAYLEKRYGRAPHPMKAIGIVEVLDFFDGKFTKEEMVERIAIHTRQLAKRQSTFNATQFPPHPKEGVERLYERIAKSLDKFL